ncbi:hypothetical protein BXZ70DRAFT_184055 [Cristinia sonorae]|uniref:Uncharacterized protein n=1 Tax=Cristinia sonorae TaxID=1940300 RepID=A0A8K0UN57_9AGAR|nr:hypothetical protein BXZ70DRAFT_184055 [Cristinia sonorae]
MSSEPDYPSLLWIAIPSIALISGYFIRKWYLARRLRLYGIGKGAPGFQTNVRRVRVPPEIAARIRRGEDVSPAEIEAASRKADLEEEERVRNGGSPAVVVEGSGGGVRSLPRGVVEERDDRHLISGNGSSSASGSGNGKKTIDTEWLPESVTKPTKRRKGVKK